MATEKTKTTTSESIPSVPSVQDGEFSLVITTDEMMSLIQVLTLSSELFQLMAVNTLKEGNEAVSKVYEARSMLCLVLYEKFKAVANIGEPTSREVH